MPTAMNLPDIGVYRQLTQTEKEALTRNAVVYTLKCYFDEAIDVVETVAPQDGFCLSIRPDRRTTSSPAGGVVGRYMAKPTSYRGDHGDDDSSSGYSSPMTPNAFSPLGARDGNVRAFNHRGHAEVRHEHKSQNDEDRNFLFLEHQNQADPKKIPSLVKSHGGRPGANIVFVYPFTNELFARIPRIPYAPREEDHRSEYNLRTYDDYKQGALGYERKKLYPAPFGSSLATCNHCNTPTSVLQNESLCPYHAYFLVTGKYLGYYELCTLVEMEKRGMSIATGWWTIEEMVEFIPFLTTKLRRWSLVFDSEEIDLKTTWSTKASPFSAVREKVPPSSRNKSGREMGMQLRFIEQFDGLDETKIGPRIAQVCRDAMQPATLIQGVSRALQTNNHLQSVSPSVGIRTQPPYVATPLRPVKHGHVAMDNTHIRATAVRQSWSTDVPNTWNRIDRF